MTVSFDFDDTFTADPEAMGAAMDALIAAGHTVIVTTGRGDHRKPEAESVIAERFGGAVPVIRARGLLKDEAAREAGYSVDVWVDDTPQTIFGPWP